HLRRCDPGTRSRRRGDDGRDDDDRQPGRLLRLAVRTGADDRQSDRESMARRRAAARTRRAHPIGPRPDVGVPLHQPLRSAHGRPVPASGGGGGMKFPVDRDTRRRWFDFVMSGATLLCVALSLLGFFPPPLVFSVISAVIALATIMIPIVARTSEEAMRLVPTSAREAALALGIPRYRAILRVVLPSCASALVTGALLGIARV